MLDGYLRKSTASQSRMIGPFVDDTDFVTLETGLTIANTDIKLNKLGAAGVNKNSGGGTHRNNGMYVVTFDATDTDTVGELNVSVAVAGALVRPHKWVVLSEKVYDAIYASSGDFASIVDTGTLAAGSSGGGTFPVGSPFRGGSAIDNNARGMTLRLLSGPGAPASVLVNGSTASSGAFTVDSYPNGTPDATTVYQVIGTPQGSVANPPTAILTAAYDAAKTAASATALANLVTLIGDPSALAATIAGVLALINAKTTNLPASPAAVGSAMTLSGLYDAAKTAAQASALSSLQTDVTTLGTSVSAVGTNVTAIRAKTDSLTFTVAGLLDVNTRRINGVLVQGDGITTPMHA